MTIAGRFTVRLWLLALIAAAGVACGGETDPDPTVLQVNVAGSSSLPVGQTTQLAATASSSNGGVETVTSSAAWASTNTAVATVSAGLVTAREPGSATISATFRGVSGSLAMQITPVGAEFVVQPQNGLNANLDQCPIRLVPLLSFEFLCTFDASASTLPGGITSYEWVIPAASGNRPSGPTVVVTSPQLSGHRLGCGGAGLNRREDGTPTQSGEIADRTVRLTVRGPGGSNTRERRITFRLDSVC